MLNINRTNRIFPFMSGFFDLACSFQGSSRFSVSRNLIPFRGGITLCPGYVITLCLSTRVSTGIWMFPSAWSLWITGMPLHKCVFAFLLWDVCVGTELLGWRWMNLLRSTCPASHSGYIIHIHTTDGHSWPLFLEPCQHLTSTFAPILMRHFRLLCDSWRALYVL